MTTSTTEPTTEELAVWLGEQTWSEFAQSLSGFYSRKGYLSEKQEASARGMYAKMMAKAAAKTKTEDGAAALESDGIYALGEKVFKVQWNQTGTSLYCKELVDGRWEYAGKAPLYKLTEDDLLSWERAAELGKLYGVCVRCGRTLTDENSIYNGYGSTCASNNGWPYLPAPALEV